MTAPPRGMKSNSAKGSWPSRTSDSLIRRLGGVPISVMPPPSNVEYASGMSKRDGATPVRRATSTTTGSINAATPILAMKADSKAPVIIMTKIKMTSRLPPIRITCRPIMSAMPVRVRPSLNMNMAQTVITAVLLNPAKACFESTNPVIANVPRTSSATTSIRMISLIKSINETTSIPRTSPISNVMGLFYSLLQVQN